MSASQHWIDRTRHPRCIAPGAVRGPRLPTGPGARRHPGRSRISSLGTSSHVSSSLGRCTFSSGPFGILGDHASSSKPGLSPRRVALPQATRPGGPQRLPGQARGHYQHPQLERRNVSPWFPPLAAGVCYPAYTCDAAEEHRFAGNAISRYLEARRTLSGLPASSSTLRCASGEGPQVQRADVPVMPCALNAVRSDACNVRCDCSIPGSPRIDRRTVMASSATGESSWRARC